MGAAYQQMKLPGSLRAAEVKLKFRDEQERDRRENGHSYSSGFGQCTSLTILSKTFTEMFLAQEWLEDNAQKWGPALAVKVGDEWVIGAWCAE